MITAGLGWASAEVILSRGIILWVGARGAEFSWVYIQKCLESNIFLVSLFIFFFLNRFLMLDKIFKVQHIITATLLWLFTRHDLNKKFSPVVMALLIAIIYKPLWLDAILRIIAVGPWVALSLKALIISCMGFVVLHIYSGLAQLIGI